MVTLFSLSACEIETHDNGKLDGFWHLEKVDTIATGGVCDMSQQKVFWSVQAMIIEVSDRSNLNNDKYIFSFFKQADYQRKNRFCTCSERSGTDSYCGL